MFNRKMMIVLALVFVFTLALLPAACTSPTTPPPTTSAPTTSAPTTKPASPTATAPSTPTAVAPTYKWKFSTAYLETDARYGLMKEWATNVQKLSNGKISITMYPNATLVKETALHEAIAKGTVETGHYIALYFPGIVPLASNFEGDAAGYMDVNNAVTMKLDQDIEKLINTHLEQRGVRYVGYIYAGMQEWSRKTAYSSLEEFFKDKLLRAQASWGEVAKSFGAKASTIAMSELYTAGQQGVVEGAVHTLDSYVARKLYEVFPYLMVTDQIPVWSNIAINASLYNNLPKDIQTLLVDEGRKIAAKSFTVQKANEEKMVKDMVDKGVLKIYKLTDAEKVKMRQALKNVLIPEMKKLGAEGEALLKAIESKYK